MEIYFTSLERAAGGSVCQLRRQHAQTAVKLQPSNEEAQLGMGFLNYVKALRWK